VSTKTGSICYQRETDESEEHHVKFLEAREDALVALEPAKYSLDLVASFVHFAAVLPGLDPGLQPKGLCVFTVGVPCTLKNLP
jgi:hypothetical protein